MLLTCHLSLVLVSICLALEVSLLLILLFSVCWRLETKALSSLELCANMIGPARAGARRDPRDQLCAHLLATRSQDVGLRWLAGTFWVGGTAPYLLPLSGLDAGREEA